MTKLIWMLTIWLTASEEPCTEQHGTRTTVSPRTSTCSGSGVYPVTVKATTGFLPLNPLCPNTRPLQLILYANEKPQEGPQGFNLKRLTCLCWPIACPRWSDVLYSETAVYSLHLHKHTQILLRHFIWSSTEQTQGEKTQPPPICSHLTTHHCSQTSRPHYLVSECITY